MTERTVVVEYLPDGISFRCKITVVTSDVAAVSFRYDALIEGGSLGNLIILKHVVGHLDRVSECNSIGRADVGHFTTGDPVQAHAALTQGQAECFAYLETLL